MNPAFLLRTLPHSIEAEEYLLSCILLDGPDVINRCYEASVTSSSFYEPRHAQIFSVLEGLFASGKACTADVLAEELRTRKELDAIGGYAFIAQISSRVPTTAEADYFINKVRELSLLREVIRTSTMAVEECYAFSGKVDELLDGLEQKMFAATQKRVADKTLPARQIVPEAMAVIQTMVTRKGEMTGLRSGFADLDALTWGFQKSDLIIIAARPSMGKALSVDSKILSFNGWIRMGDVQIGDAVIGRDGKPYPVLGVFPQGKKELFRVKFDDGAEVLCCDEHLWLTSSRADRKAGRAAQVRPLSEIRATLRVGGIENRLSHKIPWVEPMDLSHNSLTLPLDPYLLGLWLGDGSMSGTQVRFHNTEPDVIENFRRLLPAFDVMDSHGHSCDWTIKRQKRNNERTTISLRLEAMGLRGSFSETKFVPEQYLWTTAINRLALLRGLLDTDGFCYGQGVEYTTASPKLAEAVRFLVRSLGGRVTTTVRSPSFHYLGEKKIGQPSHRMVISFDSDLVPVSSAKHLKKYVKIERRTGRYIEAVEPAGVHEAQCITVGSPDGLFVTDDFVVTHNTALALNIAESMICPPAPRTDKGVGVLIFSLEMSGPQLMQRMICTRAKVNMKLLRDGFLSKNGDDLNRMKLASDDLSRATLFIDDSSAIPVSHIRARARRVHARNPLGCIIVDYLQLMAPTNSSTPREQQVAEASRGLKALAKELNVPVIVLSQLNRASEKDNRPPRLSDLRESGSIEQDADVVLMLSRPKDADDRYQTAADSMDLVVAKQRNGPVGTLKLSFLRDITRFENYTQ